MRVIRPSEYRSMPWQNGQGTTWEIAREPAAGEFDWRCSLAEIAKSCAFSSFPGYERVILRIDGSPMRLDFANGASHTLSETFNPLVFDGGDPLNCELQGEQARDLNLMIRRDRIRYSSEMLSLDTPLTVSSEKDESVLLFAGAALTVKADDKTIIPVDVFSTVMLADGEDIQIRAVDSSVPSPVFVARIRSQSAPEQLFISLYDQLRRMAQRELRRNGGPLTVSPTTLLHEAYLSLSSQQSAVFPDRARFMAYASRAMRGLIIDLARKRQAVKRGGGFEITSLHTNAQDVGGGGEELSTISDALDELSAVDSDLAQLVDLKFFCGFSVTEIAALRGVSERTVQRDWEKARMLLYRSLRNDPLG